LKILIANDDKDDRFFASLAFKEADLDHTVDFVKDGEELIAYLNSISGQAHLLPDLILLDLNMPKKDGRVALKEIRSDARFRNFNVIIFSTCISEEDRIYTQELGASRHVTRPFDFQDLVVVIRDICSTYTVAHAGKK